MASKRLAISLGLSALSFGGLHRLAPGAVRGRGVILTLHRVRPFASALPGYAPNALLEITPEFLDAALERLRDLGFEIVALAEAARRLVHSGPRFAALTFDDGYRDFAEHALPVLERHRAPATLFVCPGFVEGGARLWWLELEEAIRRLDVVEALPARDAEEKSAAYDRIYWRLRELPEAELLKACRRLAQTAGVVEGELRQNLFLGWSEIAALAAHPLLSVGAHGLTHIRLAQWPEDVARREIMGSKVALEGRLGRQVAAFCYPVGDPTSAGAREFAICRESGFALGVTTRPGMLFAEHASHLHALPRVSLNGLWQDLRSFDALMSGAPFWMWNRGRRLNVA